MVSAPFFAVVADLFLAISGIELFFSLLDTQSGPPAARASAFDGMVQVLVPLAAAGSLFGAVATIYRHTRHGAGGAGAGVGAGNRRFSELLIPILCWSAGVLEFFIFDVGALVRGLGPTAARLLPAASTATFFLGVILMLVHIRAGGEGGGGAVDGDEQIHTSVRLLTKMAIAAAAALICLMALVIYAN